MTLLLAGYAQAETTDWPYTVRQGDTLIGVSNSYLAHPSDWLKLQKINSVKNPKRLPPGLQLRIPVELLKLQQTVAEVMRVQGVAEVTLATGGAPSAIETGTSLREGDQIRTGNDSNLTLRFTDGSRLMVMANSQLTLAKMVTYGKSGVMDTRTRLQSGQVETQVTPLKGPAARYEIITPVIAVGVRGTNFRVSADATNVSRSEVLHGKVVIQGEGKPLPVPAGFGTLAEAGKPPSPPIALLKAPDLSSVATLLQRVPVRFKWAAMDGAASYRAQVFADPNFQSLLLDGTFTTNDAKWADLPDGKYFLRVRAIDAQGLEGLNAEHAFTLKARPEPPFVSAPADKGKLYGDTAQFQWTKSEKAEAYHFQLASNPEFSNPIADLASLKDLQHNITLTPGDYYWRIASRTANDDEGPFSDTQTFTMKPTPVSPTVPPPKIDGKHMKFQWPAGEPGTKHQFQLARDKDFKDILTDQTLAEPHVTLKNPGGGEYFMRVKAIEADGFAGPFGATQQVKVPSNIPWWLIIPVLLFPLIP